MTHAYSATIKQGDILEGGFGYEAYLSHFYKVVKRTAKTVTLQPIAKTTTGYGNYLTGYSVVPTDEEHGKPFRRKVKSSGCFGEYVSISSYENAYVWDGSPVENYNWH